MRRFNLTAVAALLLSLFTAGDAIAQKFPERWDKDGLVVGQIVGTADFLLTPDWERWAKLTVGRRDADGGIFRGLIVFKRGEGEHELKSIQARGMNLTFPIDRIFETKKGQITALGLMVLAKTPGHASQFRVFMFENTDETLDFIRREYPELLEGHEDAEVVQAPGRYLPKERLESFRKGLAKSVAKKQNRQGRFWVAGRAGTIAEVNVAGDSVNVLRFLPPVTYQEPITTSYDEQGVLTFGVPTRQWRVVNGSVEEIEVTQAGKPRR
jgi:hypothetical protein